jgi:hypothetical protein
VPPDGVSVDLRFPFAGVTDVLDYVFDFTSWLTALERVGNATVLPDAALALGAVRFSAGRVTTRLGPAQLPGAYVVGCAIVTPQGRQKSVSATVMLQ